MDKLISMRAFTKVVAHGSYSEAAREMRLSRSAVSKYIIDLEEELGVQLLNRTTRSASPTDNGRLYYERCLAILAEIEEADQVPWKLCTNNAEVLRDVAVAGRGIALLPTFLAGRELQSGSLRAILTKWHAPELAVYAIYPPTRHLSVKVRVFIDFMVERFGGKPYWDDPT
jgi:DNA-binding transcriptional LysR family regulator